MSARDQGPTRIDVTGEQALDKKTTPVKWWLAEIDAAKQREKLYRETGQDILNIYCGDKSGPSGGDPYHSVPFNILYSNTQTLLPGVFSAMPRPIVKRRFASVKGEDALGKASSDAGKRCLEFLLDTNIEGYETYDEGVRAAVLDGLLPGRGITQVKYDANVHTDEETVEQSYGELVCLQSRTWNQVYFGYARKWSKVPWVAFEEHIDKEEATRLFGAKLAGKLRYTGYDHDRDREEANKYDKSERNKGEAKLAVVYQIWDKRDGKKLRYISDYYKDDYLKVEDDPLGLTGFYPCPKPLQFVEKSNDLMPTPLYALYENQAKELNKIQVRINHLVDACKARGLYDGQLGTDIANIMDANDNALVPTDSASALSADKGLDKAVWFMPLETINVVLEQMYRARESCKQVIYEITGISDIMRTATKASETLGAQQIKNQWGNLRLSRFQKEVQRYTRDLLRMMLELAATKFSEETWATMTGLPFPTTIQRQQLEAIAQAAQASGQPIPPEVQAGLAQPHWGQVIGLLQNDLHRSYQIDIETNSTLAPEAAEDQRHITELMTAIGQFLNGVSPLVERQVMPFQAAQAMLLTITQRFQYGDEIEDYIRQMQPPQQDDTAAQQQALQAQQQQFQKDMQMAKQNMDLQQKTAQLEMALKQSEASRQMQEREAALELKTIRVDQDEVTLKLERAAMEESMQTKEKVQQIRQSSGEKMRRQEDQTLRRESQKNQQGEAKLLQGLKAVQDMNQTVQALNPVLESLLQNSQKMDEVLQQLLQPRTKRVVRGADGRIQSVVEEAAPQPQGQA